MLFLHLSPLSLFYAKNKDGNYGSISRSLPLVKTREFWVSQGGDEGMKRNLDMEFTNNVNVIHREIYIKGSTTGTVLPH